MIFGYILHTLFTRHLQRSTEELDSTCLVLWYSWQDRDWNPFSSSFSCSISCHVHLVMTSSIIHDLLFLYQWQILWWPHDLWIRPMKKRLFYHWIIIFQFENIIICLDTLSFLLQSRRIHNWKIDKWLKVWTIFLNCLPINLTDAHAHSQFRYVLLSRRHQDILGDLLPSGHLEIDLGREPVLDVHPIDRGLELAVGDHGGDGQGGG